LINPTFASPDLHGFHQVFTPPIETESSDYVDCHAWMFTPSSFELNIYELHALGEIDFRISHIFPSEDCEFYVTLERNCDRVTDTTVVQNVRMNLLLKTAYELREQMEGLPPLRS
jgi:hypothetical protein